MSTSALRPGTKSQSENSVAFIRVSLLSLIESCQASIKSTTPPDCGGFTSSMLQRLEDHEDRIKTALEASDGATPAHVWGPISIERQDSDGLSLVIRGPGLDEVYSLAATGEQEVCQIEQFVHECRKLAALLSRSESQLTLAVQHQILEQRLPMEPRQIVRNHIQLLQQYNDLKDVAQQFIGLIAENRGVSIASLYESDEFGVGRLD